MSHDPHDSGDRPALINIEITPEMIEAGEAVLAGYDSRFDFSWDCVREIYLAMSSTMPESEMHTQHAQTNSPSTADRSFGKTLALVFPGEAILISTALLGAYTYGFEWLVASKNISLTGLFYGLFDLFAVLTGFLLTFYLFLAVSSNAFIDRIRKSKTFRYVMRLIVWTIALAGLITLNSLGLGIYNLESPSLWSGDYWVTVPAIFLSGTVFWNVGRSIYFFGLLANDDLPPSRIPGG